MTAKNNSTELMNPEAKNILYRAVPLAVGIAIFSIFVFSGTVTAQATGSVQGTVENEIGEPISGVNVSVTVDGTTFTANKPTNEDGAFKISGVNVGLGNLSINHPDYEHPQAGKPIRTNVPITTGDTTTVNLVPERTTHEITGRVRLEDPDQSGNPPLHEVTDDRITVRVENHPEQDLIEGSDRLQVKTKTNDTSFYTLDVPSTDADESVDVVAILEGWDNTRQTINTTPDILTESVIVASISDGTITGTVTEQSGGKPVSGATVHVADISPEDYTGIEDEADLTDDTDSSGVYKIDNVPTGERRVTVTADTFQQNTSPSVTVKKNKPTNQPFQITHRKLGIDSVVPKTAQSGDTITVGYTYTGEFETLNFTVGSGQIVETESVDAVNPEGEITFDIPDRSEIEDGDYTISLETPRRTVTETIRVSNPVDPEAVGTGELDEESYRAPAGGFVEITTGGEYMLIGGDTDSSGDITQYLDVIYVEGGSTTINTRLIGTNVPSERAYGEGVKSYAHSIGADSEPSGDFADVSFQGASTLAEFRQTVGIDSRSTPLQTGRYRLLAGENGRITIDSGIPQFRKPVGRSNLVLTQPQLEAVNTYVLPPESANAEDVAGPSDDATESNTIAEGERLLIEIQATGMYGATIDDPTVESIPPRAIADLLSKPEGVDMDLSTWYYDGSDNTEADVEFADKSSSDVYIIPDGTTDQWDDETIIGEDTAIGGLYIVVDTRGEAFSAPAYGDVMEFTTAYESPDGGRYLYPSTDFGTQPPPFSPATEVDNGVEHFPYYGGSDTTVTVNSKIEYMEPSIQYGRTTFDGNLVVPAEDGGQVLGSSTLAPGTEATIQFIDQSRPDPELVTIEEVTIEEDRTFTASADFSELSSGDQVTVEFYTAGRLPDNRVIDRRAARVVDDIDNIANYQITNFTTPVEVQQRSSLSAVEAMINNTGELTGQQVVTFSIDGEPIRNESLRLSGGGSATLDLSDQFVTLPIGTYQYTIQTDNDERTGELRVTEPDSGTTITSEDTNTTTTSSPLDENEVPDENDEDADPSGIFGLVGVSGRDVALGATLTGAAHVLGYWA